ncbi:hypothetical protein PQI23_08340 [Leucobacter sp. USCH14]|uniref:hypothetical protein n=1 Tax=Leucobacter sp. USCH14 TaxID=3024838 RepID=UPI00309E68EF
MHMLLDHPRSQGAAGEIETDCASFSDRDAPDWVTGSRILFQGAFDQLWEQRCLSILEDVVNQLGYEPLVLLPDDIQLDHYESQHETVYGSAAMELLDSLADGRSSDLGNRFVFIDLEPVMLPLCTEFDLALHRLLHARVPDLPKLGVATSRPECIAATGFDHFVQQAPAKRTYRRKRPR